MIMLIDRGFEIFAVVLCCVLLHLFCSLLLRLYLLRCCAHRAVEYWKCNRSCSSWQCGRAAAPGGAMTTSHCWVRRVKEGVSVEALTVAAGMALNGRGGTECLAEMICWINKIYWRWVANVDSVGGIASAGRVAAMTKLTKILWCELLVHRFEDDGLMVSSKYTWLRRSFSAQPLATAGRGFGY